MSYNRGGGSLVIGLSFAVALMLTTLPMPVWAASWRPAWVALILIYWCLALPDRVGVVSGWMLGLLLDVLSGSLLGQHALALSVVAFVTIKAHQRVRVLPVWQQGLSIFLLVLLYQMLVLWITGIRGVPIEAWAYWSAPLTSMLIWPWVFIILRDLKRVFRVL